MRPLSFAALWHDTLADTRALMPLALPIAAAFVLLPGVAIDLFGPPLPAALRPPPAVSAQAPHTAIAGAAASPRVVPAGQPPAALPSLRLPTDFVVIDLILPTLIGLVAQLAILRLALDRRRGIARSVGEALGFAAHAWPFAAAALLLTGIPVGIGMLALIIPGIYLAGRFAPALAFVVDGCGPVAALERSWALTVGNGWRVIGFAFLFVGWFVVLSAAGGAIGGGVAAALTAAGAGGAGSIVASTIDGVVAAIFTVVNAVAAATVYRQLGLK